MISCGEWASVKMFLRLCSIEFQSLPSGSRHMKISMYLDFLSLVMWTLKGNIYYSHCKADNPGMPTLNKMVSLRLNEAIDSFGNITVHRSLPILPAWLMVYHCIIKLIRVTSLYNVQDYYTITYSRGKWRL